jgi:hypothetical protein
MVGVKNKEENKIIALQKMGKKKPTNRIFSAVSKIAFVFPFFSKNSNFVLLKLLDNYCSFIIVNWKKKSRRKKRVEKDFFYMFQGLSKLYNLLVFNLKIYLALQIFVWSISFLFSFFIFLCHFFPFFPSMAGAEPTAAAEPDAPGVAAPPRGGVTGRLGPVPVYGNFFLSDGFSIWNEHMRVSAIFVFRSILLEIHGKIDYLYYNNRKFWNS